MSAPADRFFRRAASAGTVAETLARSQRAVQTTRILIDASAERLQGRRGRRAVRQIPSLWRPVSVDDTDGAAVAEARWAVLEEREIARETWITTGDWAWRWRHEAQAAQAMSTAMVQRTPSAPKA